MFKLFIFACMLAVVVAAPKPQVYYSPTYTSPYTAPLALSTAYAAPVAYSGAYSNPYAYSTQYAYSPYAAAPLSAYAAAPLAAYPAAPPLSSYSVYSYSASSPSAYFYK